MKNKDRKHVVLPPLIKTMGRYKYPYHAVIMLICEIPAGQIATEKALMECLAKAYGKADLEIERYPLATKDMLDEKYPVWRIVSQRGHLQNACGKETQKAKLEAEGHTIVQPDPEKDAYIVQNYKDCLFDFSFLNITYLDDLRDFVQAASALMGR